jgi:ferrous-iron efflux pump FieF
VQAVRIGKGAWDALMDRAADPATLAGIAKIARDWPGVRGFHDLKTRTAGSRVFVHLHIELDGDQPLREAHEIGAGLRRAILAAYPQTDVIIHKDVFEE